MFAKNAERGSPLAVGVTAPLGSCTVDPNFWDSMVTDFVSVAVRVAFPVH